MNSTIKHVVLILCFASSLYAEAPQIAIKCSIGKDSKALSLAEAVAQQNSAVQIKIVEELRFPIKWSLPKKFNNSEGEIGYTTSGPLEFDRVDSGWTINCRAESIEGGLIRVSGTVTFTEPEFKQAVFGEHSSPVKLTDGKTTVTVPNESLSAIVHSSSTPFQVFALPGKTYEFKVARLNKTVPFIIECNLEK
jgi:hypothetical protein